MHDSNNIDTANTLAQEFLKEKRSERRWKNFRFILWFLLFFYIVSAFTLRIYDKKSPMGGHMGSAYVALVRLDGMIAPEREFSAQNVLPTLKDAFKDKNAKGLIIDINSPGGTPVQASIIHDAILAYKKKYNKKVVVVGEDLLTSGAYFISVAADKIYVNPSTLTGSIGVIMKGFGFVDTLKKLGMERRVYTAGTAKDRLDPFLPQNPEDLEKIKAVLNEVHQNFVHAVLEGRKGKLKAQPAILFSGDFWSGQGALNLGLVDGLGNLMDVMNKEFDTLVYKEYGDTTNIFKFLTGQLNSAMDSLTLR